MARGSNLKGRWGNGQPYDSVRRTGFVENTISSPKAKAAPPENAPLLLMQSEPWYEQPSRVGAIRRDLRGDSPTGGATVSEVAESRAHDAAPKTRIPTLPPFK